MERKRYPSDMTDDEWMILAPLIPPSKPGGRLRTVNLREVMNAIFYILRGGMPWRFLPKEFPPWKTVYHYFRLWRVDGTWEMLNTLLLEQVRHQAGREVTPSAGVIDSQSAKTTERGPRGYDGGKKAKGRKRHLLVDTQGLLMKVKVHEAGIHDKEGAKLLLVSLAGRFPRMTKVWADSAYRGLTIWLKETFGWDLEVAKLSEKYGNMHAATGSDLCERAIHEMGESNSGVYGLLMRGINEEVQWTLQLRKETTRGALSTSGVAKYSTYETFCNKPRHIKGKESWAPCNHGLIQVKQTAWLSQFTGPPLGLEAPTA